MFGIPRSKSLLKSRCSAILDSLQALNDRAAKEVRDYTAAEQQQWDSGMAEVRQIQTRLDEEEQMRNELEGRMYQSSEMPNLEFGRDGGKPGGYTDAATIPGSPLYGNQPRIVLPKLQAFKGPNAHRDAYDAGLHFKARLLSHTGRHDEGIAARDKLISRRGEAWFASQNETAPEDGGFLVAPSFEQAVVTYREQVGVARRLTRVIPVSSDHWVGMKQTSGTSVFYVGEENEITPSDANFARYTLTPKKRAILAYVSSELRDDALVSVMDLLASDMGHQFALKEDQEFVAGDGSSSYGGVQGVRPAVIAATASVFSPVADEDSWDEISFNTFAGTMSLLQDKYRVRGQLSWLCSAAFKWQVMDRLAINANGALSTVWVDGQPVNMFLGYPVELSDRMPTTTAVSQVCCLFGNFPAAVILGDRGGIRIATSEHVAFTSDRIAIRGVSRYDIHVHQEGDTSVAGAIVGLATHS
jgi:HK97 family phage major capsid protein